MYPSPLGCLHRHIHETVVRGVVSTSKMLLKVSATTIVVVLYFHLINNESGVEVRGEDEEWVEDEWVTLRKGRFSIKFEKYNPNVRRLFNGSFTLNRVKSEPWRGRKRKKRERKVTIGAWSTRRWRRRR